MYGVQTKAAELTVEKLETLNLMDLKDLVDATISAMKDTPGFNIGTYSIDAYNEDMITLYWSGVVLIPDRVLIVARMDGVIAGAIQIALPNSSNQISNFACSLDNLFIAAWARRYGLSKMLLDSAEEYIRDLGKKIVKISVRETREVAVALLEKRGFIRWGYLPKYEYDCGSIVGGYHYYKELG